MAAGRVCWVIFCHALIGTASGLADVRFHGNAALHDQLMENLGLDLPGAGDSAGLVTHAMTSTLTRAVTPEMMQDAYGYGAGGVPGAPFTLHGLPLIMDPARHVFPFHDVMASPAVIMTSHGEDVVMTPVSNVLYTRASQPQQQQQHLLHRHNSNSQHQPQQNHHQSPNFPFRKDHQQHMTQNQMAQNQMSQNQMAQNQMVQNQMTQNQMTQNQMLQNQMAQYQMTQNKLAQNQLTQNQLTPQHVNNGSERFQRPSGSLLDGRPTPTSTSSSPSPSSASSPSASSPLVAAPESLLHSLYQRNMQLKQEQLRQQRQHLEQQKKKDRELQQHQERQRRLIGLVLQLHRRQKEEMGRRAGTSPSPSSTAVAGGGGLDPQVVRAIVREELEQHRRRMSVARGGRGTDGLSTAPGSGDGRASDSSHSASPPSSSSSSSSLSPASSSSSSLRNLLHLSRLPGSSAHLHHHRNGTVSVHLNFPTSASSPSRARSATATAGVGRVLPRPSSSVIPSARAEFSSGKKTLPRRSSQHSRQQRQRPPTKESPQEKQRFNQQQQQLTSSQRHHNHRHQQQLPQLPQQQQKQQDRNQVILQKGKQARKGERPGSGPSIALLPPPFSSSLSSSSMSSSSSSSPVSLAGGRSEPATVDKRMPGEEEVNRALFQIDLVLPLPLPHKQIPIRFRKTEPKLAVVPAAADEDKQAESPMAPSAADVTALDTADSPLASSSPPTPQRDIFLNTVENPVVPSSIPLDNISVNTGESRMVSFSSPTTLNDAPVNTSKNAVISSTVSLRNSTKNREHNYTFSSSRVIIDLVQNVSHNLATSASDVKDIAISAARNLNNSSTSAITTPASTDDSALDSSRTPNSFSDVSDQDTIPLKVKYPNETTVSSDLKDSAALNSPHGRQTPPSPEDAEMVAKGQTQTVSSLDTKDAGLSKQ